MTAEEDEEQQYTMAEGTKVGMEESTGDCRQEEILCEEGVPGVFRLHE